MVTTPDHIKMLKEIAWNGISFIRPEAWQPVTIDKNRLLLAKDGRQIMEIKWGPGGEDTPQSYTEKLSASFKKQLDCPVTQSEIPEAWQKAIQKFRSDNFSWKSRDGVVQGLVLQCSHCNTITLMQFFPPISTSLITEILHSFVDHDCKYWAIFDIKFHIPQPYAIKNYKFAAGRFELHFIDGKEKITIKRLAPAKQLLRGKDLQKIAIETMELDTTTSSSDSEVLWQDAPSGFLAQLGKRLRKETLYRYGRMWLDSANNRILLLEMESMQEIEPEEFAKISEQFQVIPVVPT